MIVAAQDDNPEIIIALLDSGADATIKDDNGNRAIYYAARNLYLKGTEAYQRLQAASAY